MTEPVLNLDPNHKPYVPTSLSEIYDLLGSMILDAPTFVDELGYFPERNIDTMFRMLTDGLVACRKALGEPPYAEMIDLAGRAKALFAADQDDSNGKTDEGRALLFQMEDLLQAVRSRRVRDKLPDDEGEITGD
ncbi:MAG: hypothetical protein PGN08_13425 [Sphingomonas taxi]